MKRGGYRHIIIYVILICAMFSCGCSRKIMKSGASSSQSKDRTLSNTYTLLTGTALAIVAASGKDWQISSYAVDNTPVYGSVSNAKKASDILQYSSIGLALLVYAVKYSPFVVNRFDYSSTASGTAKSLATSGALTSTSTNLLKMHTGRLRPDGVDPRSFPSGHTIAAVWGCYSTAKMMTEFNLPYYYEIPVQSTLALMTLGTAWGRVEGKKHYPTDVLAAMLLGVALTDASFALFDRNGDQIYANRFSIQITNERGVATTGLAATVEF